MAETYHGSSETLHRLFARLPAILAGTNASTLAKALQLRIGVALLSQVQQAFIVKSRGGTGSDGIKWPAMKPASIAARRITRDEKKAAGIKGKRVRGLLTPSEDRRWRQIFATRKAWAKARGMGEAQASALAASVAWKILKDAGAKTRLSVFGSRQVDMCRDTGAYFRSLTPGVDDKPYRGRDSDQQVFNIPPGRVIVGTRVPYASRQHALRPLWPAGGTIPPAWWPAILGAATRGVARIVALMLGGRR